MELDCVYRKFAHDVCRTLPIRERIVFGVNFAVLTATTTGVVVTHGQTKDRSARSVVTWCTPTYSAQQTDNTQVNF